MVRNTAVLGTVNMLLSVSTVQGKTSQSPCSCVIVTTNRIMERILSKSKHSVANTSVPTKDHDCRRGEMEPICLCMRLKTCNIK